MHKAVQGDRIWFQQNPQAIVRFRAADQCEFAELIAIGEKPPIFRPSLSRASSRLNWVAVVNLIRLADVESLNISESTLRLRVCIPAIRTAKLQKIAENELLYAIETEFFDEFEFNHNSFAA